MLKISHVKSLIVYRSSLMGWINLMVFLKMRAQKISVCDSDGLPQKRNCRIYQKI